MLYIIKFNYSQLHEVDTIIIPIFKCDSWGTEKLNNLPKVHSKWQSRTQTQTQWFQNPSSKSIILIIESF